MSNKELTAMFKGYEEYITIKGNGGLYVKDFEGFDDDWNEIEIDLPYIVMERLSACELMGVKVEYASANI